MPCDVIVAGAGPAGALAATILARAGVRVQMFDRARFPRAKLCGDTLNPGTMDLLAPHLPLEQITARSLPVDGMMLTGPGVEIRGTYGPHVQGRAITRRALDTLVLEQALAAGVEFADEVSVAAPVTDAGGDVTGVVISAKNGVRRECRASMVIAADGRESRLARAMGLTRHPPRPRRWAIGAYFEDVGSMTTCGEMHVRVGHYIGVAPVPGGLTNACLVVPHTRGATTAGWRDPAAMLQSAIAADARLASRFRRSRMLDEPHVLGPMAIDARTAGAPGMLLAGDAAGFIDPITGDGLRFAYRGAELAAGVTLDVLEGKVEGRDAVRVLAARRHGAFAAKWRFNRAIRTLIASPLGVSGATVAARALPTAFRALIRYAGDCASPDRALPV